MTIQPSASSPTFENGKRSRLRTWGTRSWYLLGIALWGLAIIAFLSTLSGLFVPLVLSIIIGMLFYPLVDFLAAHHVNRVVGSLVVILLIMAVLVATLWIAWTGIISQSQGMTQHVEAGFASLVDATNLNVSDAAVGQIRQKLLQVLPQLATGTSSYVFAGVKGIVALAFAGFTALFLLFYLLSDWDTIMGWIGDHLGVPDELGRTLVVDATSAMRSYFYAVTLANLPVAVLVGITMWLLGLPMAVPVALVTLITAYIPYLGAIVSGAFAVLVALGSGGLLDAVIILAVIVGLQNILDPIVSNSATSSKLSLHPIVTLITTLAGGILFGALGAMLANPLTAVLLEAQKQVQTYRIEHQDDLPTQSSGDN